MKSRTLMLIFAAGLLGGAATGGLAETRKQPNTPGRRCRTKARLKGIQGIGYCAGHKMQQRGLVRGEPGASVATPLDDNR